MNIKSYSYLSIAIALSSVFCTKGYSDQCGNLPPDVLASSILCHSNFAYDMLNDTENINQKQRFLLRCRKNELLKDNRLYLSAFGTFIGDAQQTNRADKFGYLMRHPTSANQVGKNSTELLIHNAKFALTGTLSNWLTGHLQFLYYPNQSFGSGGTNVNVSRNLVELRRGYILFDGSDYVPLYLSIGKMAAPFGLTDTVNPFTASTVWHAFGGHAYGMVVGVDYCGINAAVMLVQGGAQFRALNSGHPTPSKVDNFVGDISYSYGFCDDVCIRVGASYEYGSAYNQSFPVTHFASGNGYHNPAWAIYTKMEIYDLTLIAEFVTTTKVWPGTHNPFPPLNVFCASKVNSFDIGLKYTFHLPHDIKLAPSIDFSRFKAGPDKAPWERQDQLVFGLEAIIKHNIRFFAEYIHTQGYSPLNFISGNTPAFTDATMTTRVPATTHSDRGARSNIILIGAKVAF